MFKSIAKLQKLSELYDLYNRNPGNRKNISSFEILVESAIAELRFEFGMMRQVLTEDEIDTGVNQSKVAAIKMYKDRTGLSLIECKSHVEKQFELLGLNFHNYPTGY